MNGKNQRVLLGAKNQQRRANERPRRKIKRTLSLSRTETLDSRLALGGRQRAQVHHRQQKVRCFEDPLRRLSVRADQHGPQRLVTSYDLGESLIKRGDVETAFEQN